MNNKLDEFYDFLIENGICSNDFISGAVCVGGYTMKTLERVLEYNTGYRTFESYIQNEMEQDYED